MGQPSVGPRRCRRLPISRLRVTFTLAALAASAVAGSGCRPGDPRWVGEERLDRAETVVRGVPGQVREALGRVLPAALAGHSQFAGLRVAAFDDPLFPDGVQLEIRGRSDPSLRRYAELSAEARRHDLYLYDLTDRYWRSEYEVASGPVEFRCDFILHLAALGAERTRVEAIEHLPRVRLGRNLVLRGHHGPGWYWDIRFVPATSSDRRELLELVERALAGDAGSPGG